MNSDSPTPSASRDPRLSNKRPPFRPLSCDTIQPVNLPPYQQSPTSRSADLTNTPADQFITGISSLLIARLNAINSQSEKNELEKKRDSNEQIYKKAKGLTSFPSTSEFFQRMRDSEDVGLTRVDKALKEHLSQCEQLEATLRSQFSTLGPDMSKSEETIKQLQSEVQTTKAEAGKSKQEASRLEAQLQEVLSRMAILEKAVKDHGDRLDVIDKQQGNFDTISKAVKDHESRLDAINEQRGSFDAISKTVKDHGSRLDVINIKDVQSMTRRLDMFSTRLNSVEKANILPMAAPRDSPMAPQPGAGADLQALQVRVDTLESAHKLPSPDLTLRVQSLEVSQQEMLQMQAVKDDLVMAEVEDTKNKIIQGAKEFDELKDEFNAISKGFKTLSQANPAEIHRQVTVLSSSINKVIEGEQALRVGLHSLESRYNNLTTEPIAKNMINAMQELYPSPQQTQQLMEQIARLKAAVEPEILQLKGNVNELFQSQQGVINRTHQEGASHADEMNRLRNDHASLSQSLTPLWERHHSQSRQPIPEDVKTLQFNVLTVNEKVKEHAMKLESLAQASKANDRFSGNLKHEQATITSQVMGIRDSLAGQVKSLENTLDTQIKILANDLASQEGALKQDTAGQIKNLENALGPQIQTLKENLTKQEGTLKEDITRQVKSLEINFEKQQKKTDNAQMELVRRVSSQEMSVKNLVELAVNVESITSQQKHIQSSVAKLVSRVDSLEKDTKNDTTTLASRIVSVESDSRDVFESIKSHDSRIKSLLENLDKLEASTSERHEAVQSHESIIRSQLDELTKASKSHESAIELLIKKTVELKSETEKSHQTLQQELGDVKEKMDAKASRNSSARQSPAIQGGRVQTPKEEKVEAQSSRNSSARQSPAVPEEPTPTPREESPASSEVARMRSVAETNPKRALQEKSKRKNLKRPRDEDSSSVSASRPESPNSPAPTGRRDGTPDSKKAKKKKKRNKGLTEEPVTVD